MGFEDERNANGANRRGAEKLPATRDHGNRLSGEVQDDGSSLSDAAKQSKCPQGDHGGVDDHEDVVISIAEKPRFLCGPPSR
jgi:hypothetical protein